MSNRSKLTEVILRSASAIHQKNDGRVSVDEVLTHARKNYSEQIDAAYDKLVEQALHNRVKSVLRDRFGEKEISPEREQLDLPGVAAPVTIPIRVSGREFVYVPFAQATWAELKASLLERDKNIKSTKKARDDWRKKMEFLEPLMKGTDLTVAEAIKPLNEQDAQKWTKAAK